MRALAHTTLRCAVLIAVLGAQLGGARADAPGDTAARPVKTPAWMWSIGGLLRVTSADDSADARLAELAAYGLRGDAPTLLGLRGDLAYQRAPIVDVGVAWAWARGGYGTGPQYADPDHVDGATLELGVFARMHWVRPGFPFAPEPRLEAGLARTSVGLRGVDAQRLATYARAGVDVRNGPRRAGVLLSVDYTRVHGDGDATMIDLPVGGVSVALSFYWRDWQLAAPASPAASAPASR